MHEHSKNDTCVHSPGQATFLIGRVDHAGDGDAANGTSVAMGDNYLSSLFVDFEELAKRSGITDWGVGQVNMLGMHLDYLG